MNKIQISESQFRKLVREEGEKIKKEIILKTMLSKIDKELNELNEVHAGGNMAPGNDGVHAGQKKAVFTKKRTHLVEDQDDSEEMGADTAPEMSPEIGGEDMGSEDVGTDMSTEVPMSEPEGDTLDKASVMAALQDLGKKLSLDGIIDFSADDEGTGTMELGAEDGGEGTMDVQDGTDDAEGADLDVDIEADADDAEGTEDSGEEVDETKECAPMEEKVENTDELRTVASLTENQENNKVKLNEEVNRWKFLAGIK